jgi:hypothetical protein
MLIARPLLLDGLDPYIMLTACLLWPNDPQVFVGAWAAGECLGPLMGSGMLTAIEPLHISHLHHLPCVYALWAVAGMILTVVGLGVTRRVPDPPSSAEVSAL